MDMGVDREDMLRRADDSPNCTSIGVPRCTSKIGPGYCPSYPHNFVGGSCECNCCRNSSMRTRYWGVSLWCPIGVRRLGIGSGSMYRSSVAGVR